MLKIIIAANITWTNSQLLIKRLLNNYFFDEISNMLK